MFGPGLHVSVDNRPSAANRLLRYAVWYLRRQRWDGRDEFLGVGVIWCREHVVGRFVLADSAGPQHHRAPADRADDGEVVADEHHGGGEGGGELSDQLQDGRLDGHVQRGGHLVAEQQSRSGGEGSGYRDALALPTGQLVGVALGGLGRKPNTETFRR